VITTNITVVAAISDVTELVSWRPLASYHVISASGLLVVVLQVSVKRSPDMTSRAPDIVTPCGRSVIVRHTHSQ